MNDVSIHKPKVFGGFSCGLRNSFFYGPDLSRPARRKTGGGVDCDFAGCPGLFGSFSRQLGSAITTLIIHHDYKKLPGIVLA